MRLLLIDTSTERGVIAYLDRQKTIFVRELPVGLNQSSFLVPYLAEELKALGSFPPALEAIGVGIGPGSYTGIRVGVAVAQALAYSWKVPLVGVSSLVGFIPSVSPSLFAAVFDARVGGIYFLKGEVKGGEIIYKGKPEVCALPEVGERLQGVTHLVCPIAEPLQAKFNRSYPANQWIWEERAPSVGALAREVERLYQEGERVIPPQQLNLLYLRQTEAEREKEQKRRD